MGVVLGGDELPPESSLDRSTQELLHQGGVSVILELTTLDIFSYSCNLVPPLCTTDFSFGLATFTSELLDFSHVLVTFRIYFLIDVFLQFPNLCSLSLQ
jgi:hypothetical protein